MIIKRKVEFGMPTQQSKENDVKVTTDFHLNTIESWRTMQLRRWIAENYTIIWFDVDIHSTNDDREDTATHLQSIVKEVHIFTQYDSCIEFLTSSKSQKVILILPDIVGQHMIPRVHDISHLDSIYIYSNETVHQNWSNVWNKIKGVYANIAIVCRALKVGICRYNQDDISISVIGVNQDGFSQRLYGLDPSFMYTQLLKEILLEIDYDTLAVEEFIQLWANEYTDNPRKLVDIAEFQHDYCPHSSIWWYTREYFIYWILNHSLRTLDAETILKMGFFISDLHRQIEILYRKQMRSRQRRPFTVYRGQKLSNANLDKLQKNKGGLICFNSFLSTSTMQEVSYGYAAAALGEPDTIAIIFRIRIDPTASSTPFAFIHETSFYDENEILFSMHTVFRIGEVVQINRNSQIFQVDLALTSNDDLQLRHLTEQIRTEVEAPTCRTRLGKLLLKLGLYNKAEEIYTTLSEEASDGSIQAHIYHQLGEVKQKQGDYQKALSFYQISLEINQQHFSEDHSTQATTYSSMGLVLENMENYTEALKFHKRAASIMEGSASSSHLNLATCYSNISRVSQKINGYSIPCEFRYRMLDNLKQSCRVDYLDMVTLHKKIDSIYPSTKRLDAYKFGETKAEISEVSTVSKQLEITDIKMVPKKKFLPLKDSYLGSLDNVIHPIVEAPFQFIKLVKSDDKHIDKREIDLNSLYRGLTRPVNQSASCIADFRKYSVFYVSGKNGTKGKKRFFRFNNPYWGNIDSDVSTIAEKIIKFCKQPKLDNKAFKKLEKYLNANLPEVANCLNTVFSYLRSIMEHQILREAKSEKTRKRKNSIKRTHSHSVSLDNNIDVAHCNNDNLPQRIKPQETPLSTRDTHPSLVNCLRNSVPDDQPLEHQNLSECSRLFSTTNKSDTEIFENLNEYSPDLATLYNDIALKYATLGDYARALEFYEIALQLLEKFFGSEHPGISTISNNISLLHEELDEKAWKKVNDKKPFQLDIEALQYQEKALSIQEQYLPSNHPDLAVTYDQMGFIHENMGSYTKALEFYDRALQIRENSFPSNHQIMATSYDNIGSIYRKIGGYEKAATFHKKALAVREQSRTSTDPDLTSI